MMRRVWVMAIVGAVMLAWFGTWAQAADPVTDFAQAMQAAEKQVGAVAPSTLESLARAVDTFDPTQLDSALQTAKGSPIALGLVLLRSAKLAAHMKQDDQARVLLMRFFDQAPNHPYTEQARALEKALLARKGPAAAKIGVLLPLSGEYRRVGEMLYQGIEVAAKEALAKNAELEIIVRDTAGTPEGVATEMEKLARESNVIAFVGPFVGAEARAAAYKASELETPLILLSPREGLTGIGPCVFRLALTAETQVKSVVAYAWDTLGKRDFAILQPMHPYGEAMASSFFDEVTRRGGRVTGYERYDDWETTFKVTAAQLVGRYRLSAIDAGGGPCRDALGFNCARVAPIYPNEERKDIKEGKVMLPRVDFDALFIPDSADRVAMLLAALAVEEADFDTHLESDYRRIERKERDAGYKIRPIQLLGGDRWNTQKLIDQSGKWAQGSVFVDGFYADEANPRATAFDQSFQAAYKAAPNATQASAYDALSLLAKLIGENRPASRASLLDMLKEVKDYQGASAPDLHTDERGEILGTPALLTVKDGSITKLVPPAADKAAVPPAPQP